jgi:hypothetical protein
VRRRLQLFGFRKKSQSADRRESFDEILRCMKESMVNLGKQKRPYSPPQVKEVTPQQAEAFIKERTNCSDSEGEKIVESLSRKQYQKAS